VRRTAIASLILAAALGLIACGEAEEGEPDPESAETSPKGDAPEPGRTPARCGPNPREAPTLEPGDTYSDAIAGSETIYCAFEVEPGLDTFELIVFLRPPAGRNCDGGYRGGAAAYEVVDESAEEVLPGPPGGGSGKRASSICEGGRDESSTGEVVELPAGRHYLELRVDCAGAGASCRADEYPIEFTISAPYGRP